jgi:recombination protein RecA
MPKSQDVTKLIGQLKEQFGDNSAMLASDIPKRPPINSGSLAVDYAIGIGGIPSDRVTEIAGAEGTGKTTLALLAMANFLDNDSRGAVILDLEHKLDAAWIKTLIGEEREQRVAVLWPDSAEQATNMYASVVGGNDKIKIPAGQVGFAIYDSIGGAPSERRNADYTVASFGGNSLAITEFARVAGAFSDKYHCATIGINQVRADMSGYNRHLVPGGHGWLHACTVRLQLKRGKGKAIEKINGEDVQIGYEIACKVVKNGVAAPGRTASYWFYNVPTAKYGFGVDTMEEILRLGILTGVIERKGGWYHHPLLPESKGENKIRGRDQLTDLIRADADLQKKFSVEIVERLRSGDYGAEVAPMSDPDAPIEESKYPNLLTQGEFADA